MYASATFDRPVPDMATRLDRVRKLAWLLDARFVLPGTRVRFGIDGVVGLVPWAGDALMGLTSLYIVWEARAMGAPAALQRRMLGNIAVELAAGTVPVVGDLFDVGFKANLRNARLLERWAARGS